MHLYLQLRDLTEYFLEQITTSVSTNVGMRRDSSDLQQAGLMESKLFLLHANNCTYLSTQLATLTADWTPTLKEYVTDEATHRDLSQKVREGTIDISRVKSQELVETVMGTQSEYLRTTLGSLNGLDCLTPVRHQILTATLVSLTTHISTLSRLLTPPCLTVSTHTQLTCFLLNAYWEEVLDGVLELVDITAEESWRLHEILREEVLEGALVGVFGESVPLGRVGVFFLIFLLDL